MSEMCDLAPVLLLAHWLPRRAEGESLRAALGEDLLPRVQQCWEQSRRNAAGATSLRRTAGWLTWLDRQRNQGARLTWGFPGPRGADAERWLGGRLVWWPRGVPLGSWVGLVSSRIGRRLYEKPRWFSAVRGTSADLNPARDILLVTEGTAVEPAVRRAAELYHLPLLHLFLPRASRNVGSWLRDLRRRSPPTIVRQRMWSAFLSPEVAPGSAASGCGPELRSLPARDRSVVVLSERLTVIRLRRGGNLERLLRLRLRELLPTSTAIQLWVGPDLVAPCLAEDLGRLGAVCQLSVPGTAGGPGAFRQDRERSRTPRLPPTARTSHTPREPARILGIASSPPCGFLSHWTRRRDGPWPGESQEAYLDRLLQGNDSPDHSAEGVLLRIVEQRTILAAAGTIRGRTPVVCFTEVPLAELPRRRVFRPHRGTWDCELFGICIRRDWLESLGARPVIYGDDTVWGQLPPELRPFFQLRHSVGPDGRTYVDWTSECEWRVPGDVNLAELPPPDGMLFVPGRQEARRLAAVSPWPVVVLAE